MVFSSDSSLLDARRGVRLVVFVLMVLVLSAVVSSPAFAEEPCHGCKPSLRVTSVAFPTIVPAGQVEGKYTAVVENVGGAPTEGEISMKDVLPAGVTSEVSSIEPFGGSCFSPSSGEVSCSFTEKVVPGGFVVINMYVDVSGVSGRLVNRASVSGGGALPASTEEVTRTGGAGERAPAGISHFGFEATGPAGEAATQAGAHPVLLTTSLLLNNLDAEKTVLSTVLSEPLKPVEPPKDLVFYLPLGMLGNATVPAQCSQSLIEISFDQSGCPPSTRIGTILPMILNNVFAPTGDPTHEFGLYNVVPERGFPAEFGFASEGYTFMSYASVVRRDGKYVLRVSIPGIPAIASLTGLIATFKGDISETFFDEGNERTFDHGAFLTDPSNCGASSEELDASVAMNTWIHPDPSLPLRASEQAFPALTGCEKLGFGASLSAGPDVRVQGDTTEADEPSGYKLQVQVPQAPNQFGSLGTPPFKDVSVAFPDGTSLSPGAANGLTACAASGPEGIDIEGAESEEEGPNGLEHPAEGHCPSSSQIGLARATTPLINEELSGHIYLAEPECGNSAHPNVCTPEDAANGRIFRLYLELQAPERGVIVKLAGVAHVNPVTGQVTAVFEDTPQFPVSDVSIETNGGPRAAFANPATCGLVTTSASIAPWDGGAPAEPMSTFAVNQGCGPRGFAPLFVAGTTNSEAGSYSPFVLTLKREDREQNVSALSTTLPPGVSAQIASVTQCSEPGAAQGACPSQSRVGTATAGIGAGSGPYYQTGQVYLTGPYDGAPFGLSVVIPAVAGPFNLGNVVVRTALFVNSSTAQVTAVTPGSGPGSIPQTIDGVPLRLRQIEVRLDQPNFTFNPTNCAQKQITGTVYSAQGATAGVSSPFAVTGCQNLPFKPGFSVSTSGRTSKAGGASLTVQVQPPAEGPQNAAGGEANIKYVKVELPEQLPARLTTLQKACTQQQFAANPAGCPAASVVGAAVAHTPILSSPLMGPAYFVSRGGEAFPQLVLVLQGEGVTVELVGDTFISKAGITSSTFNEVPDVPISSFELTLPESPHSALGTNKNLCALTSTKTVKKRVKARVHGHEKTLTKKVKQTVVATLQMPTEIIGQNGTVFKQTTNITVTGCPKAKATKAKAKPANKRNPHRKK